MVKVPLRATPLGPTRARAAWVPERGRVSSLVPDQDRRFHCFDRLGTNMEWCVRSADQVRVVRIWEVDADDYDSDDDDADEGELQEHSGW